VRLGRGLKHESGPDTREIPDALFGSSYVIRVFLSGCLRVADPLSLLSLWMSWLILFVTGTASNELIKVLTKGRQVDKGLMDHLWKGYSKCSPALNV